MTGLYEKLRPIDAIAIFIIAGCFIASIATNSAVENSSILSMVVGFYFGRATR